MTIKRVVPNITSNRMDESCDFYCGLFGFEVAMDLEWIKTLTSPDNSTAQISIVRGGAGTEATETVTVSIEVTDVDEVHARVLAGGHEIAYPLTDEPWGVRRFHLRDPNGVLLNVLSHLNDCS